MGGTTTTGITGSVAMVTGAARGIGWAVAGALAGAGATVAALDLRQDELEHAVDQLVAQGHRVHAYPVDVRDSAAVGTVVKRVEEELGGIGILANVAGVLRTGLVVDTSDEDWAAVFDVNTTGVFNVCRAVAPGMIERGGGGSIITVSSNAAGVPRMHMAAYAASKAASTAFTRCLGLELAQHSIRCNVVAPGSTDTDMLRSMWTNGQSAADVIRGSLETYKLGIPLGRLASAQDIANSVLFLASDQARHLTLQELYVDGGASLCG